MRSELERPSGATRAIRGEPDDLLVERMGGGDPSALSELFRRYGDEVLGYLVGVTRDRELAADLRQEVFLRAWRYATSYRGPGSVRGWLFSIARNERHDAFRAASKNRTLVAAPGDDAASEPVDDGPGPHRIVVSQERLQQVQSALEELPVAAREILVLSRIEGMTYEELGGVLDASPGALRVRLSRALSKLRALMDEKGEA